jgi:hypothetical protein
VTLCHPQHRVGGVTRLPQGSDKQRRQQFYFILFYWVPKFKPVLAGYWVLTRLLEWVVIITYRSIIEFWHGYQPSC